MKKVEWFERQFTFGSPKGLLPFHLERLEGAICRIEKKVEGISDEILSYKLDGKWSIKENVAHLAEVDEIALKRIDEMTSGVSPMTPAVIQPGRNYNALSIDEVLDFFMENRNKNLKKYEWLSGEDLSKSSLHPRLKVTMNPVDLAWFHAEHDDHHLVRINEILTALKK
jgi:hypothetical protein